MESKEEIKEEIKEAGKTVEKSLVSFLSNKPIWAFWIAYTVLCGILFGIFYTAIYLMALLWWIPAIVVIVIGITWGTVVYSKNSDKPKEKKPAKKKV